MTEDITGSLHSTGGAGTLRLQARLPHAVADVWAALTDRGRLSAWLGRLDGDLRAGSELEAHFAATGWEGTLEVQECEPQRRVLLGTRSAGEPDCVMELRLSAGAEGTVLLFEDRGLPLTQLSAYGAGDQVLVEDLLAHLAGRPRCEARARWEALHPTYQQRAAQLQEAPPLSG